MTRLLAGGFALTLALAAGPAAPADDKKDDKALSGVWVREASGLDLKFEFTGKDTLKMTVSAGENAAIVTSKYTVKDGVVKGKVTDVEEKGNFPGKPPKDFEFSFKWTVKGDTATLDDLKGDNIDDVKPVVEGEYKRKKGD